MFAQITAIRTPLGKMQVLRELIRDNYLPLMRQQPGLLRDYFLVQADDHDRAQLILVWDNQSDYEQFRSLPAAAENVEALRSMCLRFESQGYVMAEDL